jgi:hypothetical protein
MAIWLPNTVFLLGGVYFFRQAATESRIEFIDRLLSAFSFMFRIFVKRSGA